MKKLSLALALALTLLMALTACSADDGYYSSAPTPGNATNSARDSEAYGYNGYNGYDYADEYFPEDFNSATMMSPAADTAGGGNFALSEEQGYDNDQIDITDPSRKLIRKAQLEFETTDFEDSVDNLEQLCYFFEGYIQESNVTGSSITASGKPRMRGARYTLRVPASKYGSFLNRVDDIGNRLSKSMTSDDITDSYYDLESRLEILKLRRDRLFKLLEESDDANNIVTFERELSNTLYEIEKMTGQLKSYDRLVDYTTITVTLQEVVVYTETSPVSAPPETVGDRIGSAFGDSAEAIGEFFTDLFVFLIGNILYLLIIAAIVAAAVILFLRYAKKNELFASRRVKASADKPNQTPSGGGKPDDEKQDSDKKE